MDKTTLQIVLSAKDEVTKELQKLEKQMKSLSKEVKGMQNVTTKGGQRMTQDFKKMRNASDNTRQGVRKLIGTLQGLGAMRLFTAIGALYALRRAMMGVTSAML